MFLLFSNERVLSEATEELSPAVFHSTFTKKKKKEDNCFPQENVLREGTRRIRKKPEVAVSVTPGCVKAALRLLFVPLFLFSCFVELDCKKGDNSSVAKRRGIYPPLFIDPKGDSCFSIYQIKWIKKCRFINGHNFFF